MSKQCPICLKEFDNNIDECPDCGFKFSGRTEKFKPINSGEIAVNDTEGISSPQTNEKAALRVLSGPQGEILMPITKKSMTIGRSPDSDIFLNDRTVSRKHAVISKSQDCYRIADINSYNGLWINNKNVTVSNLKNGDIIQIGVFFIRFEESSMQ